MEVLLQTVTFFLLIVSLTASTRNPTPPTIELNQENMENLEQFFKDNPDIYGKLQNIERLVSQKDHNTTAVKILHDQVIKEMQPRIIESCDEAFFNKQRELYERIFVYRNSSKLYNISVVNLGNKDLMETATMLTIYRDQLTQFIRKCIRKGALSLKNAERFEFEKRINQSLLKTEKEIRNAVRHHSEFEMSLDVKKTFCHNIVDQWLEDHIVEMERKFIIEQRQTFIPIGEDMRKKLIHQCFIYVTIQKDYIQTCVNSAGETHQRDIHPMNELRT